ncbi:helix-turn-helix transcriptional regulator [Chitinophaga sp. RAB17]|uniref:helix-turn-helix transcriptional regulator n=1 Tax=Chitinophaga sp. RAB17 TaxID=3233049 RepID=UPI003F917F9A
MKNTLKVERAKQNMTKGALAEKAKVSRQTINAIEPGRFVPSTLLALKIAKILHTTVQQLFMLESADE